MKEILQKVRNGTMLSDKELNKAIEWYTSAITILKPFGEIYYLVWRDAFKELAKLEEMQKARKMK